jgi:hypothetical protein
VTKQILADQTLTDEDVRYLMQQIHEKEILISLGLNEGEAGALIGADLTKLKNADDQMQLSMALLTAFFKLNEHLAPKQRINYLMDLLTIVVGQTAAWLEVPQLH